MEAEVLGEHFSPSESEEEGWEWQSDEGYDGENALSNLRSHNVVQAQDDGEEDKAAVCESLWVEVTELEQEISSLQDPSWEEVDGLVEEAQSLKADYHAISGGMLEALVNSLGVLWPALHHASLVAVMALQEALRQFPVEASVLEAEPGSLNLVQAAQSEVTLEEQLRDIYSSLFTLWGDFLQMVPMDKVDAIQGKVDSWCSALLRFLPKEKTDTLREKAAIFPEQAGALKSKVDALQKWMGALKEMAEACKLCWQLRWSGFRIGDNTSWEKTVTLKVRLKALPEEEWGLMWEEVAHSVAVLCDTPVEKLRELEEKVEACIRKLGVLQNNRWVPLEKNLQFLREKLQSLGDSSHRELEELQEELEEVQEGLDYWQRDQGLPFNGTMLGVLQRKVTKLKINAQLMEEASLVVNDEERNADGCSGETGNLNYYVSTTAPHSSTGLRQTWHMEVTQKERCELVQNFAKTISPDNDSEAAKNILEAYARQIEEEVYSLANSKIEYHHLMATKLYAMNRKLNEILRSPTPIHSIRRDEQPTLQSPCIQPPGVTSLAATTGEVQTPQLPRGTSTSTGSNQMLDTVQMNNRDSGCLIQPVQRSNAGSVSMQGHVPGAAVTNSLNIRSQNSRLSHSSIHQPCDPCYEFSACTVVDIPPAQPQNPLGVAPFLPTPVSSPGSQPAPFPDSLQGQSASLGQASSGSIISDQNQKSYQIPNFVNTHAGKECGEI